LTVVESVVEAVAGRRMLVVLDNCEHVLDAAAELTAMVLVRASTVSVLATSREGLALPVEHLWPVPSLDVDADGGGSAVELFVERAEAVRPGFSLDDESDRAAVVEICRRLDGIPLAIELAAARMVSMNPAEVLERLSDRFRLLAGARRNTGRHQTLRHAVAWSYDLLSVEERDVLGRCAVFAGGFDLAAAAQLCGGNDDELFDVPPGRSGRPRPHDQLGSNGRQELVSTLHGLTQLCGGITDAEDFLSGVRVERGDERFDPLWRRHGGNCDRLTHAGAEVESSTLLNPSWSTTSAIRRVPALIGTLTRFNGTASCSSSAISAPL
jgi:hypothetical protein